VGFWVLGLGVGPQTPIPKPFNKNQYKQKTSVKNY
jgi:hypothetical protein